MQIALISMTSTLQIHVVRLARENREFPLLNMVISYERYIPAVGSTRDLLFKLFAL